MTLDDLLLIQDAGGEARRLGEPASSNPYSLSESSKVIDVVTASDIRTRRDAWMFGWSIEDASDAGHLAQYFQGALKRHV